MATSLRVTELDFDTIKQNLKTYLQGQAEFTDYDFEGSGLSVLLDILAYNTHYNAYYANMALNEMFIDTAVKRESVVSLSKMLNYVPRSVRASIATLDITVNGVSGSPASLAIDRYTAFNSTINGSTFTFYNIAPATILPVGGSYNYSGLDVYEGTYVSNKFTVGTPGPAEKYQIPNKNIDTSTLRVTVQDTATSTSSTTYTEFEGDITAVEGTDTIYFIEQNSRGYYQVYFGDGIIGSKLVAGNRVTLEYLISNGTAANVSDRITQSFTLSGTIDGYSNVSIAVLNNSTTGQDAETIDEIKFNAPKHATSQNRLITKYDYEYFLKKNYSYIQSLSVWGGEDNDPPAYGKIFMSVLPKSNQYLTPTRKAAIVTDLKKHRAVAITPEFVDPDVFYINVSSLIKYNPNLTNETSTDIETSVSDEITNYFNLNVGSFGQDFSDSKLIAAIDSARSSILSNITQIYIQKRYTLDLNSTVNKKIKLSNKIAQNTLSTTKFYYDQVGVISPARIRDIPNESTVTLSGTYRRTGTQVTITFETEHTLTAGEVVSLTFSGAAESGVYSVNTIESDYKITVLTDASGADSGTVDLTSESRGKLEIYNPDSDAVLNTNVGFISYDSGLIQIQNLSVAGYMESQTDLRIYFNLTRDSQDIAIQRNQILQLDTSAANNLTYQLAGISLSTLAVPK